MSNVDTWNSFERSARQIVNGKRERAAFEEARRTHCALARFSNAEALIEFLHEEAGDLDEKDDIYRALLTAVRKGGTFGGVAFALTWLGLLPGLAKTYFSDLRLRPRRPADTAQDHYDAFIGLVTKLNLASVNRIAATLVKGTKRDVQRERAAGEDPRLVPLPKDDADDSEVEDAFAPAPYRPPVRDRPAGLTTEPLEYRELDSPPAETAEEERTRVRKLLARVDPEAARIVEAIMVDGETPSAVARRLGITPHAVRKRVRETLSRIKASLVRRA